MRQPRQGQAFGIFLHKRYERGVDVVRIPLKCEGGLALGILYQILLSLGAVVFLIPLVVLIYVSAVMWTGAYENTRYGDGFSWQAYYHIESGAQYDEVTAVLDVPFHESKVYRPDGSVCGVRAYYTEPVRRTHYLIVAIDFSCRTPEEMIVDRKHVSLYFD